MIDVKKVKTHLLSFIGKCKANKRRYGIRLAIGLGSLLIISGAIFLTDYLFKEYKANYPVPDIDITSSKEHQAKAEKYILKLKVTDAETLKITAKSLPEKTIEKQLSEEASTIEQEIPLAEPSNYVEIEAKNKYKSSHDYLTITRDKTEQEIAEEEKARLAAEQAEKEKEQKRIDDIKNNMETLTGFPVGIYVGKDVKKSRTIGYYYVLTPEKYHYITVTVVVRNLGNSEEFVSSGYFTLQGEDGYTYSPDTATYSLNYLDSTNLQPEGMVAGVMAFIVPKDEHEFTLTYSSFGETAEKQIYVD